MVGAAPGSSMAGEGGSNSWLRDTLFVLAGIFVLAGTCGAENTTLILVL